MSRCFPFPPPGFEKKFKAENLDLLTKEKHREKKHKKDKKDKEKREHKEKKERDRSKDKHKEKKDRKEKRKDRKKSKDADKGHTSEDSRVDNQAAGHSELHREPVQKAEEGKDSKFAEEFGRRTRDDGAANQSAGSTAGSVRGKFEGAAPAALLLPTDRNADKKTLPTNISAANSLQRRAENNISAAISTKGRGKMPEKLTVGISTESNQNHGISRPDTTPWLANRRTELYTTGTENEKAGEKNYLLNCIGSPPQRGQLGEKVVASSSASTQKRNNFKGLPTENISLLNKPAVTVNSSVRSRPEAMPAQPSIQKERVKDRELFPPPFRYQKLDGKVTNEFKKDEGWKGFKDKDQSEKAVGIDKTKNLWKKDQVVALNSKLLAPPKDNTTVTRDVDLTVKKRKDLNTNGFLQENDLRPSKMPRLSSSSQPPVVDRSSSQPPAVDRSSSQPPAVDRSSSQPPVVDRTPGLHDSPFSLPSKGGAMNNLKPDRRLDNNVKKISGAVNSQQSAVEPRPPAARKQLENGDVSSKPPHPDSAYLHQIYTVPKMEAWSEVDDLDWLFKRPRSQPKPGTNRVAETAPPTVWAEAMHIDSADVLALPYVVPF